MLFIRLVSMVENLFYWTIIMLLML